MTGPRPPEGTIDCALDADRRLERTWRAQRVGWAAMVALIAGAFFGVFGDGPLATATAGGGAGAARIHYDRFARKDSDQTIAIEVPPELVRGERLEVVLGGGFAVDYQLEQATPEASQAATGGGGLALGFRVAAPDVALTLVLRVSATTVGAHDVTIAVGGGPTVTLGQWVYP